MPTGNEDLNGAVDYAVNICNDETHGYVRGGTLNPGIDCSGLVYYALLHNGFDVPASRWNTASMLRYLRSAGFTEYIYPPSKYNDYTPIHGDIWVHSEGTEENPDGHAIIYGQNVLGYNSSQDPIKTNIISARIEAVSNRGRPGTDDSANSYGVHDEVWVHYGTGLYTPTGKPNCTWHVFRWNGGPGPTPKDVPIWMMFRMKNDEDEKRRYI